MDLTRRGNNGYGSCCRNNATIADYGIITFCTNAINRINCGLIVSVFQATTQIQEATLAFVPKIVAVMLSMVVFGPWMMSSMVNFTQNLFENIDKFIK